MAHSRIRHWRPEPASPLQALGLVALLVADQNWSPPAMDGPLPPGDQLFEVARAHVE